MMWLPLFGLFYGVAALYWARVAAHENGDYQTFFSAGHALSPWMSALVLGGMSLSGWAVLDGAQRIGTGGFGLPALLVSGIALALPGVFFYKRIWYVGQRLRLSSLGELLRSYYQSEFLVAYAAVVAVLFAVGFAGLQIAALASMTETLTAGAVSSPVAATILGAVLFGYVAIGGMRVVGYLGAVQSVLAGAALVGLAGFSLIGAGGFAALNESLHVMAAEPANLSRFIVSGVVQFTAGAGREAAAGAETTALASLSLAFALMGLQASPLGIKLILSTRSAAGVAAGQTWVVAGAFGGLLALCLGAIGAARLVNPGMSAAGLIAAISPWFGAWLFIGLLAGIQLFAGLGLVTAGEALVRQIYKPWFHGSLGRRDTVTITRVVIGLMVLATVLMSQLTPVTLTVLASLALPLSFQLWTPLLGMTWVPWFTRPAVVTGVGFGIAGVLLTEPFGLAVLSFLGLDLPWGRNPWTIHSAAWGMTANLAATLLISAFTQRRGFGGDAEEARHLAHVTLAGGPATRALRSTAWSVSLAWLFLAVGPGLIFGNYAFVTADGGWALGMPSLWGWGLLFWALGLGLVWFLSYKMEMASPVAMDVPAFERPPRLRRDQSHAERERLRALFVTVVVGFGLVALTVLSFGHG